MMTCTDGEDLFTKCPRPWYPSSVISALDSMGELWLDDHLFRAISLVRE